MADCTSPIVLCFFWLAVNLSTCSFTHAHSHLFTLVLCLESETSKKEMWVFIRYHQRCVLEREYKAHFIHCLDAQRTRNHTNITIGGRKWAKWEGMSCLPFPPLIHPRYPWSGLCLGCDVWMSFIASFNWWHCARVSVCTILCPVQENVADI